MASDNDPDVAALLRSLTAYLPAVQADGNLQQSYRHPQQIAVPVIAANNGIQTSTNDSPLSFIGQHSLYTSPYQGQSSHSQHTSGLGDLSHHAKTTTPQAPLARPPPSIDPRTIIEWSAGLRYVTKLTAQYDGVIEQIRKTIANQHDNERSWWAGREALIAKQNARVEGRQKLDHVLRAVGVAPSQDPTIVADEAAELKRYDLKVHKAQTKMVEAMNAELQALGVPFFGTRRDLIAEGENSTGMITKQELMKLRRRMLSFLEDLCKE